MRPMSHLWATCRRRRHLVVALMMFVLALAGYLSWTSTSGHVVRHRTNTVHKSHADWPSHRVTMHELPNGFRHPSDPEIRRRNKITTVGNRRNDSNSKVYFGKQTTFENSSWNLIQPLRSSDSVNSNGGKHTGNVSTAPVARQHEAHHNVVTQRNNGAQFLQPAYGQSTEKNKTDGNVRKLRRQNSSNNDDTLEHMSFRKHKLLHENAVLRNISQKLSGIHAATLKPSESISTLSMSLPLSESFKEPEIRILADEKDVARMSKESERNVVDSEYGPGGGKRSPLLGDLEGGSGNCRVYNSRDELPESVDFSAGADCVNIATSPPVVVCPYPDSVDRRLSLPLRMYGVWEPDVVRLFQTALMTDDQLGVYDVGANIGQYTLLAAALGHSAVAVELHRPNIYRLHKAIRLNRLEDKVIIVENGVSDVRETFELDVRDGDPSSVKLTTQDADRFCDEPSCPPHATTILLNDLLEVTNFDAAIIKIDIEGYEHRALRHADQLLSSVRVLYIFMQWTSMRQFHRSQLHESPDKRLVNGMMDTLTSRHYTPYSVAGTLSRPLDTTAWYTWPDNIVWVLAGSIKPKRLAELAPDVSTTNRLR